jgi:hypothetical protein
MAVPIDFIVHPDAQETETGVALRAPHVITATVALNVLLAAWALLALLLDGLETRGFFLLEILPLDASLVVTARFSFVPRQIAVDAGFCAALIAGADVVSSFALLYFRQRSPLRS